MMLQAGIVGQKHLFHTLKGGGCVGDGTGILAGNQNMDRGAEFAGGGQRLGGDLVQFGIVMFGQKQGSHERISLNIWL